MVFIITVLNHCNEYIIYILITMLIICFWVRKQNVVDNVGKIFNL